MNYLHEAPLPEPLDDDRAEHARYLADVEHAVAVRTAKLTRLAREVVAAYRADERTLRLPRAVEALRAAVGEGDGADDPCEGWR